MGKYFIFKIKKRIFASFLAIVGIVIVPDWFMIPLATLLLLTSWLPKSSYQWPPIKKVGTWAYSHPKIEAFLSLPDKEFAEEEKRLLGISR